MKRRFQVTLFLMIILSSLFFSATLANFSPNVAQETALGVNTNDGYQPAQFARRTIRIAVYDEANTTIPDYAIAGVLTDNADNVVALLDAAGFDVTPLTTQDILDHRLMTADYDVFVMVDNLPRESIYNHVKEFWLGGGGILSYNSVMEYIHNSGMLVPEFEGESGYTDFVSILPAHPSWANWTYQDVTIAERMLVTQDYEPGEFVDTDVRTDAVVNTNDIAVWRGGAIHSLAHVYNQVGNGLAIALDNPDRGGRIVHLPGNCSEILDWVTDLTIRAVDWLCPRPKGRILFDISHEPRLGVDSWDDVEFPAFYEESRNFLVNHTYTFDKLYEPAYSHDLLQKYDMLIIMTPDVNLTAADRGLIEDWVASGGGLLALGERPFASFAIPVDQINQLVAPFGLSVGIYNGYQGAIDTSTFQVHPTTEGISSIFVDYIAYLNVTGPAYPIWYDQAGANIYIAGSSYGSGKVVLTGDINWCQSDHLQNDYNIQYWLGIANWLTAGEVLAYADQYNLVDDPNDDPYRGPVATALNDLGIRYQLTHLPDYMNVSLHEREWELIVFDNPYHSTGSYFGHLLDYMENGGKLILSTWLYSSYHPLYNYLGFEYAGNTYTVPPTIYVWNSGADIWTHPGVYGADNITTSLNYVSTDCANLTVFANGTGYAGLSPTEASTNASIIVGAGGRAIANAMLLTTYYDDTDDSLYPDAVEIWENEIAFLLGRPSLSQPADIQYEEGETGNSIVWHASSLIPWMYTIRRNGSTVASGVWDGESISIGIDGLIPGVYEWTISVMDSGGYSTMDTVLVTVMESQTTTTTTTTTTGPPIDPTALIIIIAAAGVLLIIILVVVMKKKKD